MNAAEIARLRAAGNKTTRDLCDALEQSQAALATTQLKMVDDREDYQKLTAEAQREASALRARLEAAEALVKELRTQNFGLAAGQCPTAYGDEYGNARCREQDVLRARLEAAREALRKIEQTADEQSELSSLGIARAAIAEMEKGT